MKEGFPSDAETHESLRPPNRVAVLDAGGQYVDLVPKAVERQGVQADLLQLSTPLDELEKNYGAIIISGSPASSHAENAPMPDSAIWHSELPILGICYGMQAMVVAHGGKVAKNAIREDGIITTSVWEHDPLFKGVNSELSARFTHGDFVTMLPPKFLPIGSHKLSEDTTVYSAVRLENKVAVQFHPEVFDDTPDGDQLFSNFLFDIAGLEVDKNFLAERVESVIEVKKQSIAEQVGDDDLFALVSGGVDSTVAAVLASGAIPEKRFHALYIDTGFMRDEDDLVIESLLQAGLQVEKISASHFFESATINIDGKTHGPLIEVSDPETKRLIIGKAFMDILSKIIQEKQISNAMILQGTNAADRIESGHSKGGKLTAVIKTHHNRVPEVLKIMEEGRLIEPLDDLHKHEIREIGHALGLPEDLIERQPFPGPGTAIRILVEHSSRPIVEEPIQHEIQSFIDNLSYIKEKNVRVYHLPVKTVGVGGDVRTYQSAVAVEGKQISGVELSRLANDLPANFRDSLNRVIFAISKGELNPPTITKTRLDADSRQQIRHAHRIVFEEMRQHNVLTEIKQCPVILLPVSFDKVGERSVVLRPITTTTYLTDQAMLPDLDLPPGFAEHIADRITDEVEGVSHVFLDATGKPPGTTEWE